MWLFELALVLVRLDHVAGVIVNANHNITVFDSSRYGSPVTHQHQRLIAVVSERLIGLSAHKKDATLKMKRIRSANIQRCVVAMSVAASVLGCTPNGFIPMDEQNCRHSCTNSCTPHRICPSHNRERPTDATDKDSLGRRARARGSATNALVCKPATATESDL